MTSAETTRSTADKASALDHAVNGAPVLGSAGVDFDSAATVSAADRRRRRDRGGRHRRTGRRRAIGNHEVTHSRRARLRLLAGSLIGATCLVLAYRLQPSHGSPFAAPSGAVAWAALIAGVAGIWLVPGLWLSAVLMRTGASSSGRLATRIGTTLAWYALVGPVIHVSAEGASVTTGGIVGMTVAATAAVCLGVALGLVRHPANRALGVLMAAVVGGICAEAVIWLSMLLFTSGVNYEHIRRLDWLIVLGCVFLTVIGAQSRPRLPLVRTARHFRTVLIFLAVVAVTAVALYVTARTWSPAQRMPSALGAEQVAAPPGVDVAIGLTALGPEGAELLDRAVFGVSDDTGRRVPVHLRLVEDGTPHQATLALVLAPSSRPLLCDRTADGSEQNSPVKLTVRDEVSGLRVQAAIPAVWCAP